MSMRDHIDSHEKEDSSSGLLRRASCFPLYESTALTGCIYGHMKGMQMCAHMHTQSIAFRNAWIVSKVVQQNEANKI